MNMIDQKGTHRPPRFSEPIEGDPGCLRRHGTVTGHGDQGVSGPDEDLVGGGQRTGHGDRGTPGRGQIRRVCKIGGEEEEGERA